MNGMQHYLDHLNGRPWPARQDWRIAAAVIVLALVIAGAAL